jgi:hypothetical protein
MPGTLRPGSGNYSDRLLTGRSLGFGHYAAEQAASCRRRNTLRGTLMMSRWQRDVDKPMARHQ